MFYEVGDELDTTGLVIAAHYNSGSDRDVTDEVTFSPTTLTEEGTQVITVTYTEGDVTVTTTFNVEVSKKTEPVTPPEPDKGCSGNIVTTSVILSVISLTGIALLITVKIIRKKKENK